MQDVINYKHLKYFWAVAHEGSIAKASAKLNITPQTISGQLSLLEERVGNELLQKEGRGLRLTDTGRVVLRYADEIFELGNELSDVLKGNSAVGPAEFIVGASSVLPKTIVHKIIEPAMHIEQDIRLTSLEGPVESMLADLAIHKVDLVLSDVPVTGAFSVKAYNHLLGESGITFLAAPALARQYAKNFPMSLNNAPLLLPTQQHEIRKEFDFWLSDHNIHPNIVAQFDDSALMKSFGQSGLGLFFMPSTIAKDVCDAFHVRPVGELPHVKQKFYAISAERKIRHPAIAAIFNAAKASLFK
ncbi:transcriptional activator NhaR [Pseudoalteromonas sp. DL2-H2.2]|uniref:transcriptional activator NhaR n=1 Tax=Pseudoalteromonas sp. DL2-H2.2 TaxID=2908889 RepID=UPI001F3EA1B4|nr:transcriptional activator NhaR [Pseudoalteromonas sp. DL2-H2.2]MCF2909158.1 transcriptional activator NhaR [Pseudoalteromonas sp. DL2-H2.2]